MRYFDDLEVGYQSRVGSWQLTEAEVISFSTTWDPQPFHIDKTFAEQSVFGELVASSLHLFAILTRLFFDHDDKIPVIAMLGKDNIRLPAPARATDLLHYDTTCVRHKASTSKTDRGVIVLADTLSREDGQIVLTQDVTLMVARRSN